MSLIALNFMDTEQTIPFRFTRTGSYRKQLHGQDNLVATEEEHRLSIPSNYGRIWRSA